MAVAGTVFNAIGAATVGFLGGWLFSFLGAPLPWMLGSMTAIAVLAASGASLVLPGQARKLVRPVVGVLAGSAFTPEILSSAPQWSGMLVVVLVFSALSTLAGYAYFHRLCGLDRVTAFFSSTPAGLTEMSLLGDSLGGNIRTMFLIHSVRVVTVLFTVPLIVEMATGADLNAVVRTADGEVAGAVDWLILIACGVGGLLVGLLIKLPGGAMIASMLFSAAVHVAGLTAAAPPDWLLVVVQVTIGCIVGSRFAGVQLGELRTTIVYGLGWAVLLLSGAVLVALAGAALFGSDFSTLLLAMAPGGMAEVALIAYALGVNVPFVMTCQVLRNAGTLVIGPMIYRRINPSPSP